MATQFQGISRSGGLRLPQERSRLNERQNGITRIFEDIGLALVDGSPIQLVPREQVRDHGLAQFFASAFDLARDRRLVNTQQTADLAQLQPVVVSQ